MATKLLEYIGGVGPVDTPYGLADPYVEMPAEAAGRPPKGEPGDADYDPGEGYLAQTGAWKLASRSIKKEGD